jgi:hypothetical protein
LAEAKLAELERKVDVIMKGLNLFLFGEGQVLPEDEIRDLQKRLQDYVTPRTSEFVKLDELQKDSVYRPNSQEDFERDQRALDR